MPVTLEPITLPPRGTPRAPDLFAITMRVEGCTLEEAVTRLARVAGLVPEPAKAESVARP